MRKKNSAAPGLVHRGRQAEIHRACFQSASLSYSIPCKTSTLFCMIFGAFISGSRWITNLPQHYLRGGCKAGTVPHVKAGGTYMINIPALLRQLGAEQ